MERERFTDLDEALAALEARARQLADAARREPVDVRYRRFEPAQQVSARAELAGPERLLASTRAGVDVHGDGSIAAYAGRVRRREIEPRRKESPFDALARDIRPATGAARASRAGGRRRTS